MYKVLLTAEAERTVESVNEALLKETGIDDWGYNSVEDIEKAERAGFLEFNNGVMTVYIEEA